MAGTQSVCADDARILGIPCSRQTVAIIYPQYATGSDDSPPTSGQASGTSPKVPLETPSLRQCSARAAQDIWEHHRPAVGSSMRALGSVRSTSEKQDRRLSGGHTAQGQSMRMTWANVSPSLPNASLGLLEGRCLTRYRNQPDKSLHQSGAAMHHHPENQERAVNLSIPAGS